MKQTLVLIHRWLQEGIIEIIEEDVITAILKQKGLIVEIDDLSILKTITTTEEINKAIVTLNKNGKDRIYNDEEEYYIFFLPERDKLR